VLPRTDIASAEQVKKGLMKRAVIMMNDGSEFTFDYGMLSPKKLVAAVNGQRCQSRPPTATPPQPSQQRRSS
jgi:hypothetical protein